jgi:hypothetical protein
MGPGLVAIAAAAVLAPAAPAAASFEAFQMPSRNIGCVYERATGVLRCDILSGLRPEPRGRCALDWTGVTLTPRGRARPTCAGDTAFDRRAPVLRYGSTWRRGALTCRSARDALRCSSRAGHGFLLARERWRVY